MPRSTGAGVRRTLTISAVVTAEEYASLREIAMARGYAIADLVRFGVVYVMDHAADLMPRSLVTGFRPVGSVEPPSQRGM